MDSKRFHFISEDEIALTPGFELVATSSAPLAEAAPGLIRFYREFMRRHEAGLTTYKTGTMSSWRKPNAKALQMLPAWLSEARNLQQGEFGIQFHSGPSEVEMMPPALRTSVANGASYVAAALPPEFVDGGAEPVLDLIRRAIGDEFALSAGWAGFAVVWNASMGLSGDAEVKLTAWLKRHPGLGHGNNFAIYERALHGIAHVNWLTLLGPELVKLKGGRPAIARELEPDIAVHALDGSVCIQAGPLPQIGDMNRGDDLPLYRRVGSFLKDLRTTEPPRSLDGLEDDTEAWFARFDA